MKTLLLTIAFIAAHGADACLTDRNINWDRGGIELNPIEKPFVHNSAWLWTSQAAQGAIIFEAGHLLRVHHHEKLATDLIVATTLSRTTGAIFSSVALAPKKQIERTK